MPPIDNIGSFSGFPQSVPPSAAEASSSAGASEGAGRARTDTEFLALWDEWERNAPQGGGEQRGIAVERLQDCLKRNAVELDLSRLSLASLPELPPHIEVLWVNSNNLSELPALPESLQKLIADDNKLSALPSLPASLKHLSVRSDHLSTLPTLPPFLESLDVGDNELHALPSLPPSLKSFDASNNKLSALPALPPSLKNLDVGDNELDALPSLPASLKHLFVYGNQLSTLPSLPPFLKNLSAFDNALSALPSLPASLELLSVQCNELNALPSLPASLEQLSVQCNHLSTLPALPASLKNLDASDNQLDALPPLPPSLEQLSVNDNHLTTLPALPDSLEGLFAGRNRLNVLPTLPASLRNLTVDYNRLNALSSLPAPLERLSVQGNRLDALPTLPPSLASLIVANNQLTSLPNELPGSLRLIVCEFNRLTQLPESINRLPGEGEVFAESNPFSERTIQALQYLRGDPGYQGPTVYFSMQVSASRPARPLEEAVAAWLPSESEAKTAEGWEAIAKEDGAPAFSAFLDRLQDTISAQRVPGFKEQVAAWLTRLSETPALREKTFLVSVGATESCQDRVALAWNNMQKAELEHRIACGACDQNLPEVVSAGREMFRLEQLDQIAREKAGTLRFVDEIEVHLAFQTKLRDSLGLSSATREMFFYNVSGVTQDDLEAAELRVKTAEDSTFSDWFSLWTPWHAVLQRIAPEGWGQAATIRLKSHETDYQSRVEAELRALDLEGDLDAERTIGKKVMNEIDLEAFGPLTKAVLAGRNQTELLDSQWDVQLKGAPQRQTTQPGSALSPTNGIREDTVALTESRGQNRSWLHGYGRYNPT